MKNKSLKLVFGLMLLSVLFIIAGCGGGGGGQKVATQATPEETVLRTFETWRVSPETSPSIVVDESGKFIRQATAAEVVTPTEEQGSAGSTEGQTNTKPEGQEASGTIIIRKLYALSEEPLVFNIYWKNVVDTVAYIYCKEAKGTLYLTFVLEFDENKWWIQDVKVSEDPAVEGIATYQLIHIKLDESGNEIFKESFEGSGVIGDIATITPKEYEDYEVYKGYSGNKESGEIAKDNSLVLTLYYKPVEKAEYIISYKELGTDNTIKESIKGLKAAIGKEVEVDKEYIIEKIDDYVYIASKSKLKGVVSPDGSLELILYYQKTLYYSVKYQDLDGNTISAASQYEKKYPCKIGDEITIKNHVISLDGYEFVKSDPDQESVTIEKDNLEIILHYQKKEVTPVISTGKYIIKRINYDTEIVISTSSEYEGDDGDTITVPNEFLSYEGYSFLESESEYTGLKIKAGETIVIELYFVALKETMTYTIEYYDTDNNSIRDADEVEDTIDAEIELSTENGNVPDIEGYKYLADKSTTTGKLEKGKELVLKLVYQKEYTISGKVTDSNNTPLSGATIQLFAASDPKTLIDTVKTDNSGSYKFIVYETGDYLLVISGSGYSPQTVTVKVPTTATRANIKL